MSHKIFRLVSSLFLALAITFAGVTPAHASGPWYVSTTGDDNNDCLSPSTPCATINGAIGKATAGDTINVAVGTYTGAGTEVVLIDKDITLSGGWDETFTTQSGMSTIDGQAARRGVTVNSGIIATLERFVVQNGSAHDSSSDAGSSGGGILNGGTFTLNNSAVSGNSSGFFGGGIYNSGTLTLNKSAVSGNSSDGSGGGIINWDAILTLNNSTVSGNTSSAFGGGINSGGTLTLNNSTVSGNTSSSGGGIFRGGTSTLNNSTVSGNTVFINNFPFGNYGGGIYSNDGTLELNNSTVSGNSARAGGGIYPNSGTVTLKNTLLAGNSVSGDGQDCKFSIASAGYNLIGNTSGCNFASTTGDLTNVDPKLGQLIGPSGAPRYHPLLSGSPAIDAGNPAGCTDQNGNLLTTDQRGVARVGTCDIGSYEYTTPGSAISLLVVSGSDQLAGTSFAFSKPLQAAALDSQGSLVSAVTIDFTAPGSGASGTFADTGTNTTSVITNADGVATTSVFTANNQAGAYIVSASATGLGSVNFGLQNVDSNVDWYVATTGNDSNSCSEPAFPCATINGAISKAFSGNTIYVAVGTYIGTGDQVVLLDKDVTLSGGWDETYTMQVDASVIEGEQTRRGVTINNGVTTTIERFHIQNGQISLGGGGIHNSGNLILNNSIIRSNNATSSDSGGGIQNNGALIINHSTIKDNSANGGSGISNFGTATVNSTTITGNDTWAGPGSGIYNAGTLVVTNSTVSGNLAGFTGHGGGIANGITGALEINNSTISYNRGLFAGGILNEGGQVTLRNTIIAKNISTYYDTDSDCSGIIDISDHNLIGNDSSCTILTGSGNLFSVDPQFSTYSIGDPAYYALLPTSPAVDAGNTATCLSTDQRGVARPQGSACDMGAYEYAVPGSATSILVVSGNGQRSGPNFDFLKALEVLVVDGQGSPVTGATVTFTAPTSGPSGNFKNSGTNVTIADTNNSGVAIAPTFTANTQIGSYSVVATVSGVSSPAIFTLANFAWFVATTGDYANDCQTPATPCPNISGVLERPDFISDDTILVAAGIYSTANTGGWGVLLEKGARLLGGWDAAFTTQNSNSTLDGQGVSRGITVLNVTAQIERFTVKNGIGSGILNSGILTMSNSSITNSSAGDGGGIYNSGTLSLNNSTVSNNRADFDGGGIYNSGGTLTLHNVTLADNSSANRGGGLYVQSGNVTTNNSILARNTAASFGPDCVGEIVTSDHNIIGDISACSFTPGNGDLPGVDPLLGPLQDNGGSTLTHALLPGSPAIDAGNPGGCSDQNGNLLTTDQRGVARPQGARCDIGAFELEADGGGSGEVTIDIKPGSQSNPIKPKSIGKIPVAILSTGDFDAPSEVDKTSLTFGRTGDELSLVSCNKKGEDVNDDGLLDLVCQFKTKLTGFKFGDTEGILKGQTLEGVSIEGRDLVRILK